MKRQWFRDKDGTFYRNANLVHGEANRLARRGCFLAAARRHKEWERIFRKGVDRKDRLGWRDVEVKPRSFREAYPQYPIFWQFDDDPA